jgi:hypothetical protein
MEIYFGARVETAMPPGDQSHSYISSFLLKTLLDIPASLRLHTDRNVLIKINSSERNKTAIFQIMVFWYVMQVLQFFR